MKVIAKKAGPFAIDCRNLLEFQEGDELTLSDKDGKEIVKAGYAEEVKPEKKEEKAKPKKKKAKK